MYDNKDQKELIILPVQFRKRTKMLILRHRALEMPRDITQNMEIHGSITGKMMMCIF